MSNEEIYDKEIAPALLELCNRCQELGFSFVAQVEWEPGETGRTESQRKNASFKQLLTHWAARCGGNVDSMMFTVKRYAMRHGHSSIILHLLGVPESTNVDV